MSTTKAIAYISRSNKEFSPQDIDNLLIDARNFNADHNITGVLLYNTGFFYQYIEGPIQSINQAYARIEAATSHQIIMELQNDFTDKRYCLDWQMGFCTVPQGSIQELAQQSWMARVPEMKKHENLSLGLHTLLTFWGKLAPNA